MIEFSRKKMRAEFPAPAIFLRSGLILLKRWKEVDNDESISGHSELQRSSAPKDD